MNARFSEDCTNSVAINIELLDMLLWECARAKHLDYIQTNTANEIESMKERKAVKKALSKNAVIPPHAEP